MKQPFNAGYLSRRHPGPIARLRENWQRQPPYSANRRENTLYKRGQELAERLGRQPRREEEMPFEITYWTHVLHRRPDELGALTEMFAAETAEKYGVEITLTGIPPGEEPRHTQVGVHYKGTEMGRWMADQSFMLLLKEIERMQ